MAAPRITDALAAAVLVGTSLLLGLVPASALPAPAPQHEATTVLPDSIPGVIAQCTDFRSGTAMTVRAQHLLASGSIAQGWTPDGTRLCLGTVQGVASTAISDGGGGAIVVWVDDRTGDGDLYAQRFTVAGAIAPGWPSDGVPVCVARGSQYQVALASDGAGSAVAVWQDYRAGGLGDIYAQRVTSAGQVAWASDGIPVCTDPADQGAPAVAPDGVGGTLVVWQDRRGGAPDLYFQHLTLAGTVAAGLAEGGTPLVTADGAQINPTVVSDGDGGAIVVWEDHRGADADLYGLRVNAEGQPVAGWPAQGVPVTAAPGHQRSPVLASDGAHGAVVAWCDEGSDRGDIRAQRVTAAGSLVWSSGGLALCAAVGEQSFPAIVSVGDSGVVVAWEDYRRGGHSDLYAQRVTPTGASAWAADGVPICIARGDQYSVALAPDSTGGVLATWSDAASVAKAGFFSSRPVIAGPVPKLESVESGPGRAKLTWRTDKGDPRAFALERRLAEEAWRAIATLHAEGEGLLVAEDRDVPAGARAHYRLTLAVGEERVLFAEVAVDIPAPKPLTLAFARYEEGRRAVRVGLTLASNEAARLELFDVAGRRVTSREVGSLGAGDHDVRLELPGHARSGIYFIRLCQGRAMRAKKVTVLR